MSPQEKMKSNRNKSIASTADASSSSPHHATLGATRSKDESTHQTKEIQDSCYSFFYLTADACNELPRFQYKGQDQSLLYAYVLSPLAQWCVDHLTPRSIAPNTITSIGLLFMISSYGIMWYYAATLLLLQEDSLSSPPRWIYLWNAICIFLYQTLDNIDGKQARRTGSSSPLGLLFDHGCDAVNSLFGSTGWMICMQLHLRRDALQCFIVLFGPYALFYIGTWEEYYTGELIMPIVNGPNEGLLGAIVMSLTSFVKGPEFWQGTSVWDQFISPLVQSALDSAPFVKDWPPIQPLRNADLLVLMSTFGFIQETSQKVYSVSRRFGGKALATLLPFANLVFCCLMVAWIDLDIWLASPRTSLHLCAALFVESVTDLMLKHTTNEQYQSVRWIQLPLLLFTLVVVCGYVRAGDGAYTFLIVYASAAIVYLSMKIRIIVHEICCLLNIWCFDIATARHLPASRKTRDVNGHSKVH